MKKIYLICTIAFMLCMPSRNELFAAPFFSSPERTLEIQRDQKELKEYKQRLNKLVATLNRGNVDKGKTLFEAIKADIRREVSQIKARTIQQKKGLLKKTDTSLSSDQLSSLTMRAERMNVIKRDIAKIAIHDTLSVEESLSELVRLLKEFEVLMKDEIASLKGGLKP
ncbi:MAG: hypothetical protein AAF587_33555 [Bacteroidota bacterium]